MALQSALLSSLVIISIQPEGRFWQEPEPSQATGMALAHCILGSFLGVGCYCFPPALLYGSEYTGLYLVMFLCPIVSLPVCVTQ